MAQSSIVGARLLWKNILKKSVPGNGDVELYEQIQQPAYISGNAYFKGAEPSDRERVNYKSDIDPEVRIFEEGGDVYFGNSASGRIMGYANTNNYNGIAWNSKDSGREV